MPSPKGPARCPPPTTSPPPPPPPRPEKSEVERLAMSSGGGKRVDAVRLGLSEGVRFDGTSGDVAQTLPPLALPSSGSCGRRHTPSQPSIGSRFRCKF